MRVSREECVELWCQSLKESEQALFCDFGDRKVWVPKSQIHDDSEVWEIDQEGEIIIPEEFAHYHGLI